MMRLLLMLLVFQVQQPTIQEMIDKLTAERAQLLAIRRDCSTAERGNSRVAIQAVIDKLVALKGDAQATPDIDALFDQAILILQARLAEFAVTLPQGPCALEATATTRIGEINAQLPKLEALKVK